MAESEKSFSKLAKTADAEMKALDARWRLYETTTKNAANSTTFLAEKQKYLAEKLKLADTQVEALQKQYDILKEKKGVTAQALANMSARLDEARIRQAKLREELERIEDPLRRFNERATALGNKLSQYGAALTKYVTAPLTAAGAGLFALVTKAAKAADELTTMANQTGLSIQRLQELRYVTSQTDAEFSAITNAATQLGRRLATTAEESKRLQEIIAALGIQARNADGSFRSLDDLFPEVVAKLADMQDVTLRNAYALELFGRGGTDILPLLNAGSAGIAALTRRAHELGLVLETEAVEHLAEFNDKLDEIKQRFAAAGLELAETFLPILEEDLLPLLEEDVVPAFRDLVSFVGGLAHAFNELDPATKKLAMNLGGLMLVAGPLLKVLGPLVKWVGVHPGAALGIGVVSAAGGLAAYGLEKTRKIVGDERFAAVTTGMLATAQQGGVGAAISAYAQTQALFEQQQMEQRIRAIKEARLEMSQAAEALRETITNPSATPGTPGTPTEKSTWLDAVRDKLSALDTEIEIVRAKFKLLSESLSPAENKTSLLNKQLSAQYDELRLLEDRIEVLTDAYNRMAAEKGAMAAETRNLYLELLKEKEAYLELKNAIKDTEKQMGTAAMDEIQAKTIELIRARQVELLNTPGGWLGALELQRVLTPDYEIPSSLKSAASETITIEQTLNFYGPADETAVRQGAQAGASDLITKLQQRRRTW